MAGLAALSMASGAEAASYVHSPDVTADLSGTVAADEDVVVDGRATSPVVIDLGALPGEVEVDAVELLADGDRLFSLDVAAVLPGGLSVLPSTSSATTAAPT